MDVATKNTFDAGTVLKNYEKRKIEGGYGDITGLSEGETYYCRIQAHSELGSSLLSDVFRVTTIPRAPSLSPQERYYETKVDLSWSFVPGAVEGYVVNVASDANFFTTIKTGLKTSHTNYTISGLSRNTEYYVEVRSKGVHGLSGGSNRIKVQTR